MENKAWKDNNTLNKIKENIDIDDLDDDLSNEEFEEDSNFSKNLIAYCGDIEFYSFNSEEELKDFLAEFKSLKNFCGYEAKRNFTKKSIKQYPVLLKIRYSSWDDSYSIDLMTDESFHNFCQKHISDITFVEN